jgi:predicted acylesterase/phospholipase RssA
MSDSIKLERVETNPQHLSISDNYKVLVLSGGGLKGVILLGMLHRIFNTQTSDKKSSFSNLEAFVGTSIGSVICFLLIIGLAPVEILSNICTGEFNGDSSQLNIPLLFSNCGVLSIENFFEPIQKRTEEILGFIPTMLELYELFHKEFVCVTHNITLDETIYIDHLSHPNLSCIEALKMSCNIPFIFEKYMYDKCFFIDGAFSDNFAVEYTCSRYKDKKILGLYIEKDHSLIREKYKDDIMNYTESILSLSVRMNSKRSKKFQSSSLETVMVTVGDNFPNLKLNSSQQFESFSLGFKAVPLKEKVKTLEDEQTKIKKE